MPANPNNVEERLIVVADALAALIAGDSYFAAGVAPATPAVPVMTERTGDINATIAAALARLGLSVMVVAADAQDMVRQGGKLQVNVRLVVIVAENYLINQSATGSKKPALAAAVRVMKAVDRKSNGLDPANIPHRDGLNEFRVLEDEPFRLVPDRRFITYHVTVYTDVLL